MACKDNSYLFYINFLYKVNFGEMGMVSCEKRSISFWTVLLRTLDLRSFILNIFLLIMKFLNLVFCIVVIYTSPSTGIPVEDDLTLTAKEKHALDQFRPLVLDLMPHSYMKTDIYLIKWLRASKLNLKAAREMAINNLHWREENQMDTILNEDFHEFEINYPTSTDGHDYEGRPVVTMDTTTGWDVRQAMVTGKGGKLQRYAYRLLELGAQKVYDAQRRGENVTQGTTLMNLKGFSLIQHACARCIPLYINLVLAFEYHYPGMAHKIVLINTPATFEVVLAAVRPVMSKETREALTLFGTNKQEWMKYILAMVPPDQLDFEFGGDKFD